LCSSCEAHAKGGEDILLATAILEILQCFASFSYAHLGTASLLKQGRTIIYVITKPKNDRFNCVPAIPFAGKISPTKDGRALTLPLLKVSEINFDKPESVRNKKILFLKT